MAPPRRWRQCARRRAAGSNGESFRSPSRPAHRYPLPDGGIAFVERAREIVLAVVFVARPHREHEVTTTKVALEPPRRVQRAERTCCRIDNQVARIGDGAD